MDLRLAIETVAIYRTLVGVLDPNSARSVPDVADALRLSVGRIDNLLRRARQLDVVKVDAGGGLLLAEQAAGLRTTLERWSRFPDSTHVQDDKSAPARAAEKYSKSVMDMGRRFGSSAATLATLVVPSLPQSARILDVGAGSGVWSRALAERLTAADVTLLDLPEVNAANPVRCPGVLQIDKDLHELTPDFFNEGEFDCILFANLIHLFGHDQEKRLLEVAHHALAPGGQLIIVDSILTPPLLEDEKLLRFASQVLARTTAGYVRTLDAVDDSLVATGFELLLSVDLPLKDAHAPVTAVTSRIQEF